MTMVILVTVITALIIIMMLMVVVMCNDDGSDVDGDVADGGDADDHVVKQVYFKVK